MNREEFEIHEQDFRFFRTSCGLLGFIVFFIGSFLAFIIYSELDDYSQLTFILGGVSLFLTFAFFFCVMNESKKIILPKSSESMEMTPLINQQQSNVSQLEPEQPEPDSEPHWGDKTRHDCKYVRSVMNLPPGASDETVESENDPDPDVAALQQMRNSGSSGGYQVIREPSYDSIDSRTYESKPNLTYESIQSHTSKHDCKYVRGVTRLPPGASDETVESENDPDPDVAALQQMRNSGSSGGYQVIREPSYDSIDSRTYESNPNLANESIQSHTCELKPNLIYESLPNRTSEYKPNLLYELKPNIIYAPLSESSKTSQDLEGDIGSIGSESIDDELHSRKERTSIVDDGSGSFDVELHSQNARTSIVDDGNSEITDSRPNISPLKGLFSSSDSTKSSSTSLEKENGTSLEKETENVLPKRRSSTNSEVEPENPHVITSEVAKSDKFSKSE